MVTAKKRKADLNGNTNVGKRLKLSSGSHAPVTTDKIPTSSKDSSTRPPTTGKTTPSHRVNKLAPSRPFPKVPTSVSATGPRSARKEGKNFICLTRKTPLGTYLRRCKDTILKDGYKTIHLSAMGAAIPLLLQLSVALPPILSFPEDEIHLDIRTDTVQVQDELVPDDEDEDITYRLRGKSTLMIILKIGAGDPESTMKLNKKAESNPTTRSEQNASAAPAAQIVEEPDQEMV